jgi:hypothetical protein
MKSSNLTKLMSVGALAIGLSILPAHHASAQTSPGGTTAPDTTVPNTTEDTTPTADIESNDGFDWGWLGLIGLAGLAGLKKRENPTVRYREPETTRPGYRE